MGIAEIRAQEPVPFNSVEMCPACARPARGFRFEYDALRCVRDYTTKHHVEVSQFGDSENPHLHVTCDRCGFLFHMQVKAP